MSYTFGRGERWNETIRDASGMLRIDERDLFVYVQGLPGEHPEDVFYRIGERLYDAVEKLVEGIPLDQWRTRDRAAVCEVLGIRAPIEDSKHHGRPFPPRPGAPRPSNIPRPPEQSQ